MFCLKSAFIFVCCVVWTSSNPTYRQPCPIHGNPINPYLQPVQPQPQQQPIATIPQPCNSFQPVTNQLPPLQQELGQMIVQKLFSNPTLQAILNQNPGVYPHTSHTPNVVNNYFIVPGELFLNNTNECKKEHVKKEANANKIAETNAINEANKIINEANQIKAMEDRRNEMLRRNHGNHFSHPDIRRFYEAGFRNRDFTNRIPERNDGRENQGIPYKARSRVKENIKVPNEEEILHDFRSKFPHIPEHIARNMLQNMRERVQKQYSNSNINQSKIRVGSPRNANRRRSRNRRPKVKTNEVKDDITTSRIVVETTTNPTEFDTKNAVETTTPFEMPELGAEDEIPNIENGLEYDDYYPDFTIDNQAHVLGEIRPYEERPRRKNRKKNKHLSEEVIYRSPPGLESPDFITSQVNRKYGNLDMKAFNRKRDGADIDRRTDLDVETVHAGSKVINYGVKDSDESKYDDLKSLTDGASIVMAKSYAYPEEYDW